MNKSHRPFRLVFGTLCVMLLLTAIACKQDTPPFIFAFISDTHIGATTSVEDLKLTVKDINQMQDIAFVVITGDITEFGSDEEFKTTKSILEDLDVPWHIIPGNHDSNWSESGTNSFDEVFGYSRFAFSSNGYFFIGCASGPNMRMAPGLVPHEDIVWLRKTLKKVPLEKPVIFLNHYPLTDALANWYLVIEALKKKNIQAVLNGHGHHNEAFNFEGIPATMGRSNLRVDKKRGGYNLVKINGNKMMFYERTTGIKTALKPWRTIVLKNHHFAEDTTTYARPSYAINQRYPAVQEVWSAQASSDVGTGIIAAGDKAINANSGGFIVARDLKTGEKKWSFQTKGKIYSTPAAAEGKVVVASTDGTIYGLDLEDGSLIWQVETDKGIVASPVIDNQTVFIGSSEGKFRALFLADGSIKWVNKNIQGFVVTRPLVDKQRVYFGTWGNNFYALNKESGELDWTWSSGKTNRMFSAASVYPVKADGKIFITAPDRYITSLDAGTGKIVWRSNKHKGREAIGISSDKELVFTKSMHDTLFAYSTSTNSMNLKWALNLGYGYEIGPSPITTNNGVIYVPTDDGRIFAVSRKRRAILWVHKISNALVNYVLPLSNGDVLATTMDGKVVRLSYNQSFNR